jgi:hypothetical protein
VFQEDANTLELVLEYGPIALSDEGNARKALAQEREEDRLELGIPTT